MRVRFDQQLSLGIIPISEVKINRKTRHQLAPLLVALQYVFTHVELSEEIFKILEEKILKGKKSTGRLGMSLWEILVLGTSKLNLEIDYDFLHDLANSHTELRGILGVEKGD
jgi:IS5 family transposase